MNDLTPKSAVAREIEEEEGIQSSSEEPIYVETVRDLGRRGADFPEWRSYQAKLDTKVVTMSDEADIIGWYAPDEIRGLDLTIPTEHFLKKLELI